jgi:hypothetical protein
VQTGTEAVGLVVGGLGALCLSALLVPFRNDVSNANAALVLVLPVLAAAIIGGRWAGAATAVVSALCFDFFFTKPYLSLRIGSHNDIETTLVLVVVALVAAELGIRSRARRAEAREAQSELARLRRVADVAARGNDTDDVVLSVCAELIGLFGLADCRYERVPAGHSLPRLARGGVLQGTALEHVARGFVLPEHGLAIDVVGRGRPLGQLVLEARPGTIASLEQRIVAVALADELGLALASENNQQRGLL